MPQREAASDLRSNSALGVEQFSIYYDEADY